MDDSGRSAAEELTQPPWERTHEQTNSVMKDKDQEMTRENRSIPRCRERMATSEQKKKSTTIRSLVIPPAAKSSDNRSLNSS